MGGIGSGKYQKYKSKPTTEDYYSLDMCKLSKVLSFQENCRFTLEWRGKNSVSASVDCRLVGQLLELHYIIKNESKQARNVDYVNIAKTKCNFGGERRWFVCPGCNKKARILYAVGKFRCRTCHHIYHPSSNEGELFRATRALCKYQDKLSGKDFTPLDGVNGLSKPKWMRYSTYVKLQNKALSKSKLFAEHYNRTFF